MTDLVAISFPNNYRLKRTLKAIQTYPDENFTASSLTEHINNEGVFKTKSRVLTLILRKLVELGYLTRSKEYHYEPFIYTLVPIDNIISYQ